MDTQPGGKSSLGIGNLSVESNNPLQEENYRVCNYENQQENILGLLLKSKFAPIFCAD
jgi:hypothetical protein